MVVKVLGSDVLKIGVNRYTGDTTVTINVAIYTAGIVAMKNGCIGKRIDGFVGSRQKVS